MKELRKKIDYFMLTKGGYALLIATIATVLYFVVLQWSNDYVEKADKLVIGVDDDGYLSVNYDYEDKENIYILWETDAGNIKTNTVQNVFSEQVKKDTKGYYGYSAVTEKAIWNPTDSDGYTYSTATVRAVLYEKHPDSAYIMDDYVTELTITLNYKDGKITKVKDRLFSNPIRDNSETEWNQIYCIEEKSNGLKTYRYRTGADIEEEVLILCWESEEEILFQMDYAKGFIPESICMEGDALKLIKAATTIICDSQTGKEITAYLVDKDTYNQNSESIKNDKKKHLASINLE